VGFELTIAAKRDPVAKLKALHDAEPVLEWSPPVATVEISGLFSEASGRELESRIESVLHHPADTIVIRFSDIACNDSLSLAHFAKWLTALRRAGHDVRLVSGETHVDALLSDASIPSEAGVGSDEADALAGRLTL
jgi:anti-anti-sigma regulatory factor